MKPCNPRWHDDLADHALGLRASAALAEHLANCAVCSEVLRQWKAQMVQIDAGIHTLTDSEPPADAVRRVMVEARAERQRAWLPRWKWQTAAVVGLVIVIASFVSMWKVHEQRKEAENALSAASAIGSWRSPTESLLRRSSDRWLNTPPQLGKYFYPLKTSAPQKEGEDP